MNHSHIYVGPGGADYRQGDLTPAFRDAVNQAGGTLCAHPADADVIVYNGPAGGLAEILHSRLQWLQLPSGGVDSYIEAGLLNEIPLVTSGKNGPFNATVGEQGLAFILAAARRLVEYARAKSWQPTDEWWHDDSRGLTGRTVLIFGCGGIGSGLISRLKPFDVRIIAVNRSGKAVEGADLTIPANNCESILPEADYVAISAPLTRETRGFFDEHRIGLLKSTAWIVTLSRGQIVDTDALVRALRDKRLGGAALELVDPAPLPDDHPLWHEPRALIVPHTATIPRMKVAAMAERVRINTERYLAGRKDLLGIVDVIQGY